MVGREPLHGLDNARVQRPASLLQEAPVGHLVGQGVLEGECRLEEQPRLVEELAGPQLVEAVLEGVQGPLGEGL